MVLAPPRVGGAFLSRGDKMSEYNGDTKIFKIDELDDHVDATDELEKLFANQPYARKEEENVDLEEEENKPNNKKKKTIVLVLVFVIITALTSFFYYRSRIKKEVFDPFSLIEISVDGSDGHASLLVKEKEVLTEKEADILERIEYIYPTTDTLSNKDEVTIEVDILDEKWFEESKIALEPRLKKVLINDLETTENIAWTEALKMKYTMRKDDVHIEKAFLDVEKFPEETQAVFKEAFLDIDKKEDLAIGDEVIVRLRLSSRQQKELGKLGYRIDNEETVVKIDEFVYVPRYISDIPDFDRLVSEKYAEMETFLKNQGATNIRLARVCYNDAMDPEMLKIYKREGYDADNGTLMLLVQYTNEVEDGDDIQLSKVAGYTNLKAKNKALYKEPSPIEFFYEEIDIDVIGKYLMDDGFECMKP